MGHMAKHSEGITSIKCRVKTPHFNAKNSVDFVPANVAITFSGTLPNFIIDHKIMSSYKTPEDAIDCESDNSSSSTVKAANAIDPQIAIKIENHVIPEVLTRPRYYKPSPKVAPGFGPNSKVKTGPFIMGSRKRRNLDHLEKFVKEIKMNVHTGEGMEANSNEEIIRTEGYRLGVKKSDILSAGKSMAGDAFEDSASRVSIDSSHSSDSVQIEGK